MQTEQERVKIFAQGIYEVGLVPSTPDDVEGEPTDWEDLSPEDHGVYEAIARELLEATAPRMSEDLEIPAWVNGADEPYEDAQTTAQPSEEGTVEEPPTVTGTKMRLTKLDEEGNPVPGESPVEIDYTLAEGTDPATEPSGSPLGEPEVRAVDPMKVGKINVGGSLSRNIINGPSDRKAEIRVVPVNPPVEEGE